MKQVRKLRRAATILAAIDFFPGAARHQVDSDLRGLELALSRALFPDEPNAVERPIASLALGDHQGRTWATRNRPWVATSF